MRKKLCHKCGNIIRDKNHKCEVIGKRMTVRRDKKDKKKDIKEVKETHRVLNTYRWQKKRAYIKKRDNYMCQRCWSIKGIINNSDLQVHHIKNRHDYPHLIFDNSNLICLCGECNRFYIGKNELDFEYKSIVDEDSFAL